MIAGAVAGSATVLITNPIWVVNTRMTAKANHGEEKDVEAQGYKKSKKPSTVGTLLTLLKEEGPSALFAGVLPALVLVINPILQYTIYEQLKNFLEKRRKVGPRDSFLLGALGKLLATSITYPYITVKSRAHVAKKVQGQQAVGMAESLNKIVREEGYAGLYKGRLKLVLPMVQLLTQEQGIVPKVSQSVLTAAFLFAVKDVLYDAMVKARQKVATKNAVRI
jgi:solute carrier family 25 (peroxisomal adenine nucleotide transporter), member 17